MQGRSCLRQPPRLRQLLQLWPSLPPRQSLRQCLLDGSCHPRCPSPGATEQAPCLHCLPAAVSAWLCMPAEGHIYALPWSGCRGPHALKQVMHARHSIAIMLLTYMSVFPFNAGGHWTTAESRCLGAPQDGCHQRGLLRPGQLHRVALVLLPAQCRGALLRSPCGQASRAGPGHQHVDRHLGSMAMTAMTRSTWACPSNGHRCTLIDVTC